jgi:hypothetical protein
MEKLRQMLGGVAYKDKLIGLLQIIIGNIGYALVVQLFILPKDLLTSGTTGISIVLHVVTDIPVPPLLLMLNVITLIMGFVFVGKGFAMSTVLSTFISPIALEFWQRSLNGVVLTENLLLNAIFAGLGIGVSLGIVLRAGSSTGGLDVLPIMAKKYLTLPLGAGFIITDMITLLSQGLVFPWERVLYGLIIVIVGSISIDKMTLIGTTRTEVKVISEKPEEVKDAILKEMGRGVTMLNAERGYTNRPTQVVLSVIYNRELPQIIRIAHEIDPACFLIVGRISEVHGEGFSRGVKG